MVSKKASTPAKAKTATRAAPAKTPKAARQRKTGARAAPSAPAAAPAPATPRFDPNAFDLWASTHLAGGASVHRHARSGGGSDGALDVATLARPGAVLEVHFADGSTLYTAPGDFLRRHVPEPPAQRGGSGDAPARLVLPFDLAGRHGPRQRAAAAASAIERYAVSELTEPSTLDQLFDVAETFRQTARRWFGLDAGDTKALPLAAKLCAAYENAALHDALGSAGGMLLRWGADGWAPLAPGATLDAAGRPVLLLLHGTASSTEGSFGKLWGAAGDVRPDDFARLAQSHLLLAWEHRSLTLSPVDNAIGLLDALLVALPQRCRVDVLSHSRGGLVGELFSLRSADALDAAEAPFAALFGTNAAEAAHPDHARIEPLFARLRAAKLRFEAGRFVRVACPARGTLLADGRTDLFLSLLLRAVSLATSGIAQIVVERITGLVRALVAARADARHLPGLEAMVPGSALTLALARCQAQPTDRLRVIAGDAAARGLSGILTLVADAFYGGHDHDYVVHTRSMFGGLRRSAHPPLSLRWEHALVSHFAYFAPEQPARKALLGALAGQDDRFAPLADDEDRTRGTRGVLQMMKSDPLVRRDFKQWRAACNQPEQARKPVLVVLAGIMGSELKRRSAAKDDPVWLTLGSMIGGGLDELDLGRTSADPLVASGLLAFSYERLLERAQAQFSVLCFPFDWRLPIADSGAAFAAQLQEVVDALADQGVPVHVLAHSMGGLVARHALYIEPAGRKLWGALKQRDSRLVMLGTPNRGAYAPAQLLLGQHSMSQVLGLLARKVSAGDLSRYGAGFPGLMAMLPQDPAAPFDDLFDPAAWDRIAALDSGTVRPQPAVLKAARDYVRGAAFRDSFDALCQDPHAFYVAGSGLTPLAMRPAPNPWIGFDTESGLTPAPAIDFMAGPDGDGTVPWTSALAPARTWYAPCEHGILPDHSDSFEAYFELLASGATRRLPQQPPRRRSSADEPTAALVALPRAASPALLPASDEELADYILQQQHAEPRRTLEPDPIEVRVVHGGLDYARYPLIVGHYQHEPLSGASKRVDEKLRGQLRRVLELRLFVGAALTAHYLRPNSHSATEPPYRGALVLGLGSLGELTPGSLADTVTRGVLRYAFEHIHRDPYAPPEDQPVDLRLSTLLVGTQSQAFTVRDSLGGLLFGVWRAAQLLLSMGGERPVRIRELELVEIDEHTALDAAYELRRLLQRGEWAERLSWKRPVLELREGAVSGYRPRSGRSAWQRLIVRGDGAGGLAFSLIGERARVESTRVQSDVQSLARLIDRISDGHAAPDDPIQSPTDPGFGSVLYQLLLPPELKSRLVNLDNTVLVLDRDTARYPWELLSPPLASAADGDKPRPFAVHAGLVRQRDSEDFRRLPTAPTGHHALIVGAPDTGGWLDEQGRALAFSDLPGARAEAELVRRLLDARDRWRAPTALISQPPSTDARTPRSRWDGKSFEHVRVALLEKPYRLLHLCGHGVVDQWIRANDGGDGKPVRKTGMVLSDQEVLGAVDVAQMSAVPEFVFINCCYSGRDGELPAGGEPARARRHAALAASLALAFIELGAKAVIAAGWQVDDAAALQFAESFYERLLGGLPFGEAVRSSRAEVYARYGETNNTWGAYQCYGDPQWQLAGSDAAAATGTSRLQGASACMSSSELAALIQQVIAVAGDKPPREVLGQLDRLVAALQADPLRRGWLDESRVCAALGLAYRELDEHATAAYHLQRGARTAYSDVQIGQLELLVNSLSRVRGKEGQDARKAARSLLDHLNRIADNKFARWPLAPTALPRPAARSERDCLLAGEQLRKASASMPAAATLAPKQRDAIAAALREAGRLYAQGYRSKCDEGDADARRSYALSNALLASALLALFGNGASAQAVIGTPPPRPTGPPRRALAKRWLHEAELLLDELAAADDQATFWRQAALLELRLARGLFQHTQLKEDVRDPADVAPVRRMIDEVLARWPSPIQLDSLRHRFELVRFVAAHPAPGAVKWARLRHDLALLCEEALDKLTLPRSRTY